MMPQIHPTAVIGHHVELADDVVIGPYCVVEGHVVIGPNVELKAHVYATGHTHIGEGTIIYPFASIGTIPQDLKYNGEASSLVIGKNNTIREHVTINPGTEGGGMVTRIGNNCLLMVGVHVGHDAHVGHHVIFANNATLAGHVHVGDYAVLGGLSAIHQFVRVGAHSMVGGMSGVEHDVIPFTTVMGNRANFAGVNLVGMRRRGFTREDLNAVRTLFSTLFEEGKETLMERLHRLAAHHENLAVEEIFKFMTTASDRAFCTPERS